MNINKSSPVKIEHFSLKKGRWVILVDISNLIKVQMGKFAKVIN